MQNYFDLKKRPYPSTRKEVVDTLVQKGFVRLEGNAYAITHLGALVLAKRLSDFEGLGRKAVRVLVYDGISKAKVKGGKDTVETRGYAAGFEALIYLIYNESALEDMSTAMRRTTHAYPKKAIREVLGNALVHQELTERGTGVTVEIFDDRIEVTNPGLPILPVDRFIDENQSRNEKFADALRQLGICEERGHGMDAVVAEIEGAQLPPLPMQAGQQSHDRDPLPLQAATKPHARRTHACRLSALLPALREQPDHEQPFPAGTLQNREEERRDRLAPAGRGGDRQQDQAGGCQRGQQADAVRALLGLVL